jgi:hypothetical protein
VHVATGMTPMNVRIYFLFTMLDNPRKASSSSRNCIGRAPQGDTGGSRRSTIWWSQTGSNRRPHACKARALPTELWPPDKRQGVCRQRASPFACEWAKAFNCRSERSTRMVGLGGLEPPTSRLSSARSNQLSYKPEPACAGDQAASRETAPN